MLKSMIFFGVSASLLIPATAAWSQGDRHPGIYRFTPLPPGYCAEAPPPATQPQATTPRVRTLGELPPAYVILLSTQAAPAPAWTTTTHQPTPDANPPGYNPCAHVAPTLMRVK